MAALTEYQVRRDFTVTPEPSGGTSPASDQPRFVVQKHAARRLHYDFRLELDGVLKSWAVPKGPSLDPGNRRLAVRVEDHPLEYGSFEGTIPEGEYGGGTVMLWDRGTWEPEGDPFKGLREGKLKFRLFGTRLKGGWRLVRMEDENWLLFKDKDDFAGKDSPGQDRSVATGRTMEEIAQDRKPLWAGFEGACEGELPDEFRPSVASPAEEVPEGEDWLHEVVLQGVRLLVFLDHGSVRLLGPENEDWCERIPAVVQALGRLELDGTLLDGTLVALRDDGTSDPDLLWDQLRADGERLRLYLTDAVYLGGYDLTGVALEDRKKALRSVLDQGLERLRYGEHVKGRGEPFRRQACRFAVNGVVSRKASGRYRPGPDPDWRVVGCGKELKVQIAGVELSSPEREMYPEIGVTKADLARYYRDVADLILPHLEERPLSLVRCPQGHTEPCFFQKHEMKGLPKSVHTITIEEKDGTGEYLFIRDLEGLIALVQLGTMEFHPWGSRVDRLERPDRMIFDLDPGPEVGLAEVIEACLSLRELLQELGLESFARVTGGKGLHVVVPLLRRHEWDEVRSFSRRVCEKLEACHPDRYTVNPRKNKRRGKLFLDYLRNGRGATAVASYSTRARPGAPLALPVAWDEVTLELAPDGFTLGDRPRRDPWDGFFEIRQGLTKDAWSKLENA